MITLQQLSDNFQRFNANKAADEIIMSNGNYAIDLTQGQMIRGRMPDGSIIGTYRSPFYAEFKNLKNPLAGFGVVDLNFEGNYYKGMAFTGKYPNYKIIGRDGKTKSIEGKYGDPLGLDKTNFNLFRNKNDKDFIEKKLKPLFK